jgi:HD-GYP domain-containing protein (c-di-GMP phosphodiesterase class II)
MPKGKAPVGPITRHVHEKTTVNSGHSYNRHDHGSIDLIVRHHHERWDGGGYPDGLKETAIILGARIIALADSFDAMTSDRPYRKGQGQKTALNEIRKFAGSQFDPALAHEFVAMIEEGGTTTK